MVLRTMLGSSYRSQSIPVAYQSKVVMKRWNRVVRYFIRRLRLQLLKNLLRLCFSCRAHGAVFDGIFKGEGMRVRDKCSSDRQ